MNFTVRDRSLIMGQGGGWRKIRWGLEKKSQQGGGLPKFFCLMRGGGRKKINLFHQIILVKETNIVKYLVLVNVNLDHSECEV